MTLAQRFLEQLVKTPSTLGWLSGVRNSEWNDDAKILMVGSPDRFLVLGQAPPVGGNGDPAFKDGSGRRIRALLGLTPATQYERVDFMNVWPYYEGRRGKGDCFDGHAARELWTNIGVYSRNVLMLGGAAFALRATWGNANPEDRSEYDYFQPMCRGLHTFYSVPHPSGVNRWWNAPSNRARAEVFFSSVRSCL